MDTEPTYRELFKIRNFLFIWAGQAVSYMGDQIHLLAIAGLLLYEYRVSTLEVGTLLVSISYSTNPTLANSCTECNTKAPPIPNVVFNSSLVISSLSPCNVRSILRSPDVAKNLATWPLLMSLIKTNGRNMAMVGYMKSNVLLTKGGTNEAYK